MKLPKEYFADHRNLKHYPASSFLGILERECKKAFGVLPNAGNVFAVESELDSRLYSKLNIKITSWERTGTNTWVSSSSEMFMLKLHDVHSSTTMIIYRK